MPAPTPSCVERLRPTGRRRRCRRVTLTLVFSRRPGAAPAGAIEADAEPGPFVTAGSEMREVLRVAERFARVDVPILILGETGVGKEVLAAQVHQASPRRGGPFVTLNCAALSDAVLESELFGHEKGAFTGADRRKIGFLEAAHGGTLLLDELGDMPVATQVKLLRFLETKRIARLGSTEERSVDVRILSATHHDLQLAIEEGRFREDLYYRLSTCRLVIPRCAASGGDRVAGAALRAGRAPSWGARARVRAGALSALMGYAWPGNIRELRNAVEHAVVMSDGDVVRAAALPRRCAPPLRSAARAGAGAPAAAGRRAERIERALEVEGHNQTRAAARGDLPPRAPLQDGQSTDRAAGRAPALREEDAVTDRPSPEADTADTVAGPPLPADVLVHPMVGSRYRILGMLGGGGMGNVYLAYDLELDERVAVKLLKSSLSGRSDRIAMLRREVKFARRVTHPNVLRTFDIGEHEGGKFITMELVVGRTLADRIAQKVPFAEVLRVARAVCAGLGAAHDAGVLHRDLKPSTCCWRTTVGSSSPTSASPSSPPILAPACPSGRLVTWRPSCWREARGLAPTCGRWGCSSSSSSRESAVPSSPHGALGPLRAAARAARSPRRRRSPGAR